jgi:hypothetical protein
MGDAVITGKQKMVMTEELAGRKKYEDFLINITD